MQNLKNALEKLDSTIDRLESALDQRLTYIEQHLAQTRLEVDAASMKAKNAAKVGERLDQVIDELSILLGEKK